MQKSLRTCVAALLACIMVLEIPLFAFADTAAGITGDTAGVQTEEQLGNSGDEQGSDDTEAAGTDNQDSQGTDTEGAGSAEGAGAVDGSVAGAGAGDNLSQLDLSELLTQLEQTEADGSSPRPLPVPDAVKDGNYFFIASGSYSISEQSSQKLYIPIQRTGDLSQEASITLKLIDVTSHKGVNYKAEIYNENVEGIAEYGDVSMVDLIKENTDTTYESSGITDEELNELIKENGGAIEVLDTGGNVVGKLKSDALSKDTSSESGDSLSASKDTSSGAQLAAEDSNENSEAAENQTASDSSDEALQQSDDSSDEALQQSDDDPDTKVDSKIQLTGTGNPLKDARNEYTGVVSDRQELIQGSSLNSDSEDSDTAQLAADSADEDSETGAIEDEFIGTEYTLSFAPGEDAKYLVITPLYSAKAEGDSVLQLMLRDPSDDFAIEESTRSSYVTITDCDTLEEAYISIADSEIYVTGDKAEVTVTRSGAVNKMLCVTMTTTDGTAEAGNDFSGVGAKLYFPMGISKRTVEIPVGHGTEEKTFTVQISNPVDCSIVNASAEVTISSYADSDVAELEDSKDKIDSRALDNSGTVAYDSSYIGGSYDLSKGELLGNSWYNSDMGYFVGSGVGQDDDTWAGGKFKLEDGFLYDGVRVTTSLESKSPSWGVENVGLQNSGATEYDTAVNKGTSQRDAYAIYNDTDRYNEWVIDMVYGSAEAPDTVTAMTLTSSAHGRTMRILSVEAIKRSFTFKLEAAATPKTIYTNVADGKTYSGLSFENATDAETQKYQKVILNSNLTDTSYTVKSGQNFAVSAIGTEYAKLVGIDAVRADGKTYRIANVDPNTRTCVIEANSDTIKALAMNDFVTWSTEKVTVGTNAERDGDSTKTTKNSYSGTIKIRPVFEYIDAAVQINSTDSGYFTVNGMVYSTSQEVTKHLGDKLNISTTVTAPNTTALGISYSQAQSKGTAITKSGTENYLNTTEDGTYTYTYLIDQKYNVIEPTFNQVANTVKVRVAKSELAYFDTSKGFLATAVATREEDGDDYVYTAYSDVKANDIIQLYAYAKNDTTALLWKDEKTSDTYSGNVFYIIADPSADKNVIRLSADTDASTHSDYTFSGTIITNVMNLSTGNAVENTSMYASKAIVALSMQGALTGETGEFSIDPFYAKGGTKVRYAVTYNGGTELKEIALPAADTKGKLVNYHKLDGTAATTVAIPVTSDYISVSEYSLSGAHVTGVDVAQEKLYVTTAAVLEMNGKKTVLQAYVHDGDSYELNGTTYTEKVTEVNFLFIDPKTNTVHGQCPATKAAATDAQSANLPEGTSLWSFTFDKFAADQAGTDGINYNYGDVLYVQIISDKKLVDTADADDSDNGIPMQYKPVSTGYSVISDNEYEAQEFNMDPPLDAASMMSGANLQDETRASYGQFPFLGEINFVAAVIAKVVATVNKREQQDLRSMLEDFADEDDLDDDDDSRSSIASLQGIVSDAKHVQVTIVMFTKQLPYGGTRLLLGARISVGTSNFEKVVNPYQNATMASSFYETVEAKVTKYDVKNVTKPHTMLKNMKMAGAYAQVALQVGLYLDFGYMELETTKDDGTTEYSHSIVLLGGGAFIGGSVSVTSFVQTMIYCVPCYFGLNAGVNATIFLGISADPKKTLDNYLGSGDMGDLSFNIEWLTKVYVSGYAGVGMIGALGVRGTVTLSVEVGASNKMAEWYPNVGESWGLLSTFTLSGSIDFFGMSIPLGSFSWALPGAQGYYGYFKEVRMANNVIYYVNEAINDLIEDGEDGKLYGAIEVCKLKIAALEKKIDSHECTAEEIADSTKLLRDFAYHNDILGVVDYVKSTMYTVSGLARLTDDAETSELFYIPERTDSEWVAGEGASLEGAYGFVKETEIVSNAYSQPSTKLISLGGNKMLMVYIDTDTRRDASQQAVLKYTVYDSATGKFTLPEVIQSDGTGDTTPNLCDAGDYIMVSWSSADPVKYKALTEEDLKDPTKIMSCYEIYTVLFDKSTLAFGDIEQLTDDEYCDSTPQGIYDSKSSDRVVLYLKSAPDTDAEASYEEYTDQKMTNKVLDYINPYSKNVYTVVMYMLYDASKNDWARDYYYDNEMTFEATKDKTAKEVEADYIAKWKGQRFLPSVLADEDGQNDPAITDLTVTLGYNGIGAYAYTVDMDYDSDTTEDKELYIQFYNFEKHKTYVPIRLTDDAFAQSMPQFVRNDENTYLFWLEGTDTLKYINVSQLLKAKYEVEITADGKTTTETYYIVQPDGTFADGYDIEANIVDNYGYEDDGAMDNIGTYQVFTDANDDLYVLWTRTEDRDIEKLTDIYTPAAREIYATAMVKESDLNETVEGARKDTADATITHARWSKPYQLTTSGKTNDGVAAALDADGNLILAYNQYTVEYNYGYDQDVEGEMYNTSPITLMAARLEPIGSLEATKILVSDETPMAGDTITVGIGLENAGLTAVRGASVEVWTYKDGKRIAKVHSEEISDTILVNTRRTFTFEMTVPADYEGMQLVCVTKEKNKSMAGGYYPEQEFFSEPFEKKADLAVEIVSAKQNGDAFDITYTVTNNGNDYAAKDTTAQIHLATLYGNAKDKYGVDSTLLVKQGVTGVAPATSETFTETVVIPSSVFKYCGYDQINAYIVEPDGESVAYASSDNTDDAVYIMQEAPLNFTVNGGEAITLKVGATKTLAATYEGVAFLKSNANVVYTVADTSVATVENGVLKAVGEGATTVTATLLPYGTQASVDLTVTNKSSGHSGSHSSSGKTDSTSKDESDKTDGTDASGNTDGATDGEVPVEPTPGEGGNASYTDCKHDGTCPITKYEDATVNAWYHDAVHYVLDEGLMNGVSKEDFAPSDETTRAMVATILNRIDGETAAKVAASFDDITKDSYYENAVNWAEENGIVTGYSDREFAPNDDVTREQMVAMLYRYAKYKGIDTSAAEKSDISAYSDAGSISAYALTAMKWAYGAGVIKGRSAETLAPKANITRAEIAQIIKNYVSVFQK